MYTLHIANKNYSSWSLRPWLLLRALGIPFREVLTPFSPTRRNDYLRFSPSGKVPCLIDGDLAVWDSLAIVEYLAERHPGVWPDAAAARAWARCACSKPRAPASRCRASSCAAGGRTTTSACSIARSDTCRR